MNKKSKKPDRGFSSVEALVSVAVFVLLTMSVSATAGAIIRQSKLFRENTSVASLADQYMEIARNLPYGQIGTVSGNPHGNLTDLPNPITTAINGVNYQIYYAVSYVDDPSDGTILAGTDPAPNDYKQVKLYVKNISTNKTSSFFSTVAPKGLESMSTGGALAVEVFDSVGQPVPNATVVITNTALIPNINLTRTTGVTGTWVEVGLPNSANSYHVVVSKNNYSSDQTYPSTVQNPDPIKADATISDGLVTQISFQIDLKSNLVFNTLNSTCSAIPDIDVGIKGDKLIGTPNVFKFDNDYVSDSNGKITLNNIEWDTYTPTLSSNTYMLYGSSPIQQINLLANTSKQFNLILGPKSDNAILVIVKDGATGNSIEGAEVTLERASFTSTKITNGSIWSSQDWTGGSGQASSTDPSKYLDDSGTIDTGGTPSGVRLANFGGTSYASAGTLTSSSFDTGTEETAYTTLEWQPTSQDPATTLQFQIATNNDGGTWDYVGPDGTAGTYFTIPGTTIHTSNNAKRYIRYKAYLSTGDDQKTPVLTSVNLNYVSGCSTPGQAIFPNLEYHTDYQLTVSKSGYQDQVIPDITADGYDARTVLLSP